MENSYIVTSGCINVISSISSFCSTCDFVRTGNAFSVPLISQVIHVIVIQISGQSYITTFANVGFSSGNGNYRSFEYINFERFAQGSTSVASGNFNCDSIRIRSCIEMFAEEAVVAITIS